MRSCESDRSTCDSPVISVEWQTILNIYSFNIEWIARRSNYLAGNRSAQLARSDTAFLQSHSQTSNCDKPVRSSAVRERTRPLAEPKRGSLMALRVGCRESVCVPGCNCASGGPFRGQRCESRENWQLRIIANARFDEDPIWKRALGCWHQLTVQLGTVARCLAKFGTYRMATSVCPEVRPQSTSIAFSASERYLSE